MMTSSFSFKSQTDPCHVFMTQLLSIIPRIAGNWLATNSSISCFNYQATPNRGSWYWDSATTLEWWCVISEWTSPRLRSWDKERSDQWCHHIVSTRWREINQCCHHIVSTRWREINQWCHHIVSTRWREINQWCHHILSTRWRKINQWVADAVRMNWIMEQLNRYIEEHTNLLRKSEVFDSYWLDMAWYEMHHLPTDGMDHCCLMRKRAISSLHLSTHTLSW